MYQKTVKSLIFLLNVLFILSSEFAIYFVKRDYSYFIDRLSSRLSSINILYVKIFQAFALNNSLIDDHTNNKLLTFTDKAPWNYSDMDLGQLVSMADKYNIDLPYGYEVPINSGMISLVFKGYDKSKNKQVIIKMKRKGIQQKLDDAIDNLLFLMYILSFIPIVHKYQLSDVVHNNIEIIRHQTNFKQEIENMKLLRENCNNLKYIKIPTANEHITAEYDNIIVMEYIHGMKINEIQQADYEPFAKLVVKFGIVTTIIHGVTHGDLHGGNILFIKDNADNRYPYKLGVIDFGIIHKVESHLKGMIFDVITNLFEKSPRESAIKLLHSGILDPPEILTQIPKQDYEHIVDICEEMLSETINQSKHANQIQIYKFLSTLRECLSKKDLSNIGIRPSDQFVKGQLILAMSHGVTLTLCKDKFIPLMDTVINELFRTNMLLQLDDTYN
jgi:predicted unusual protein kinase regulating ubiquinone biosynthesis (AarF/ABC1/UbiB family)